MKKNLLVFVLFVMIFPHPYRSSGWGRVGHAIVAEIAFHFLDSATKANVQHYLGDMSIEEAANWMDQVRSDHRYDYMKNWHYVNIEKGQQYEPTKEGNAINELNKVMSELKDKQDMRKDDIRVDIMIIMHLVGDLHQPLHVGYGSDKGGNDVKVNFLGEPTSLHRVWDTQIIEEEKISAADCLKLYKMFDKDDIASLKTINVEEWIHQPRSLLAQVYDFKDDTIDQAYIDKNKKAIEEELLIAGIRLASVLQEYFKS